MSLSEQALVTTSQQPLATPFEHEDEHDHEDDL
jgi:hypothetical protein